MCYIYYILYMLYIIIYYNIHPRHHHNGFVATCRLWMVSGGVHALFLLEQQSAQQALGKERKYINYNRNWFMTHRVLNKHKAWSIIHTYIVKLGRRSNAPILLITTMDFW